MTNGSTYTIGHNGRTIIGTVSCVTLATSLAFDVTTFVLTTKRGKQYGVMVRNSDGLAWVAC